MGTVARIAQACGLFLSMTISASSEDAKLGAVAAENFYADIVRQIGGDRVEVASILNNPNQDPHLFETTPTIVRQIAAAQIVIFNGAGYDSWMGKLLESAPRADRTVVAVAELVNKKQGDNPHLWYEPTTMPTVARALATAFSRSDPAHAADYAARLQAFTRRPRRHSRLRSAWSHPPSRREPCGSLSASECRRAISPARTCLLADDVRA